MEKTLHFKSKEAYQKWLAYGHIHHAFHGKKEIVIHGHHHKVYHYCEHCRRRTEHIHHAGQKMCKHCGKLTTEKVY